MLIRKIGKTLRSQAKPYQIITAATLGALIGFAPPFTNAPMYLIGVVLLLAILNANFFIATFVAALCKLLSLALMPVSFELGLLLVDGPLQPLFKMLVNAPVTAWMGLDYYVTAGGTVIGLGLGVAIGLGIVRGITAFRKKMAALEADSEKYADFVSKRAVRIGMWVLFGGKAKLSYAELMEQKKVGTPVRPLGIALAVLVVALLVVLQQFASAPLITTLLKGQLEQFYGATVDVDGVELDLTRGEITVDRLAMADPNHLAYDLIRAEQLRAKLSTTDLLRKRFTIDTVVVDDAVQGIKRDRPGVLIGQRPKPSDPTGEGKTIDEWFEQAKTWKDRLETYHDWYRKIKGPPKEGQAAETSTKDRLREWAARYGHAGVRATHLVQGRPSILVRDTKINKLRATWPKDQTLDIHVTNLSTHPALVPDPPRVTVKSSGQTFDLDIAIAPAALPDKKNTLKLTLRNQSIDQTLTGLDLGSQSTLKGGTWQAGIDGAWSDLDGLDLPLTLVLQDTTLSLPSIQPTTIERIPIQFGVTGAFDAPRLTLDREQFMRSLMDNTGKAVLDQYVGQASDELKKQLDDALGEDGGGAVGDLVDGLLNRSQKKDDEGHEAEETEDTSVTDRLRGIGRGLLGGDDDQAE